MKNETTATRAKFSSTDPRVLARRRASGLPSSRAAPSERCTAFETRRMAQRNTTQVIPITMNLWTVCHPDCSNQAVNVPKPLPRTMTIVTSISCIVTAARK